jgi:hypothetical protein
MTAEYKRMILKLVKNVAGSLVLTAVIIATILFVLSQFFNIQMQVSSVALVMGVVGTTLAFAGNNFMADALGRYDGPGLPQYIWGNRMQSLGFALTITALLIK